MSNPNNCETCDYTALNRNREGHCYMFRDAPDDVCMKHSARNAAELNAWRDFGRAIASSGVNEFTVQVTPNV